MAGAVTEKELEEAMKKWITNAKKREGGRERRRQRSSLPPAPSSPSTTQDLDNESFSESLI